MTFLLSLSSGLAREPKGFAQPPLDLHADVTVAWFVFIAASLLIVAAVVVVAVETRRTRSFLPLAVFASSMLWIAGFEALVDVPMALWFADNAPVMAYTMYGRSIPLADAATGGAFFLGGWGVYRLMISGSSWQRIVALGLILGVFDWILEMVGASNDVFRYYGNNPGRIFGLPIYSMVQNIGVYIVQGWVILRLAPLLKGWRSVFFLPVMSSAYIAYAFGCTWPAYMVIHSDVSALVAWPLILLATVMNAALPYLLLRSREVEELRAQTPEPRTQTT